MGNGNRKKIEDTILFWMGVLVAPFGVILTVVMAFDVNMKIATPISLLIAILISLLCYIYVLNAEIKDKDYEIKRLRQREIK